MTPRPNITAMAQRIRELEIASIRRPLGADETAELDSLIYEQRRRRRRLPKQIAACEQKLSRLRSLRETDLLDRSLSSIRRHLLPSQIAANQAKLMRLCAEFAVLS
jgi:hypothetical protein